MAVAMEGSGQHLAQAARQHRRRARRKARSAAVRHPLRRRHRIRQRTPGGAHLLSVSATALRHSRRAAAPGRQRHHRALHQQIRGSTLHTRETLSAGLRRRPAEPEPSATRHHTPERAVAAARRGADALMPQRRRQPAEPAHHPLQCRAQPAGTLRAGRSGVVPG